MMNAIAPVWDGNETWLVLGGLGLLAAFPLAYAIIIPAVYFPIVIMLLALVFRGVAFEFRYRDAAPHASGTTASPTARLVATFAQGIVLGAFIQGFQVDGRAVHRQQPRLLHAVLAGDRGVPGVRLRAAGRRLAGAEDRGRVAGLGAALGRLRLVGVCVGGAVVSVWTPLMRSRDRAALVLLAEHSAAVAGADRHRC